jgi:hypothetical protein
MVLLTGAIPKVKLHFAHPVQAVLPESPGRVAISICKALDNHSLTGSMYALMVRLDTFSTDPRALWTVSYGVSHALRWITVVKFVHILRSMSLSRDFHGISRETMPTPYQDSLCSSNTTHRPQCQYAVSITSIVSVNDGSRRLTEDLHLNF